MAAQDFEGLVSPTSSTWHNLPFCGCREQYVAPPVFLFLLYAVVGMDTRLPK
jgi:hypothetical protein